MTRIAATLALATATLAGVRGLAHANDPDKTFDPLTMDRHTPASKLDVDFSYIVYDEPQNVDLTAIGLAIGGQYVTPKGFGGYLTLPLSYISVTGMFGPIVIDDSELAIGNLELGGIYAKSVSDHLGFVLHGGFALPTAGDDGAAALQLLGSSPRYGDLVQRLTNSTWLRLGVSPMGRVDRVFWRVDVGIDLALDEDNATTYSPVFRINVGGGLDLGTTHLLIEFVSVVTDNGSQDESGSTLALGARFRAGRLRPGIGLILPIDIDNPDGDPDFAITASLAARL